ncbi:MAG: hypothetical protein RM022_032675 [Nostoc sp. EfeVER01]|uniref:hypothetical protein n=1 Tax=unclassified Nostoc TaxID=2593658 RepID=UPI002AD34B62|nr:MULTISPECIES: hypothetical protein [unclassified Nostoc]MDZ7944000.1 hypothetical protein [Nostoc sp. EfeVER01]MDZ7993993.1 hypothetical protein [Nostoc sp. EspVER01]
MKKKIIQSILVFPLSSLMLVVSGFNAVEHSSAATNGCYWMENYSGKFNWVPAGWVSSKQNCYALDSCDGGLGQSGGGCYKWATDAQANREPWFSCYWMENTSGQFNWVPAGWVASKTDCYALDSCDGGLGQSGGGCYKWALSPSSNREPWH